jgi:hypothetical protein
MDQSLSPEIKKYIVDLQQGSSYSRRDAAHKLGELSSSNEEIVVALMIAKVLDNDWEVREVAAESLLAPVHQAIIQQCIDLPSKLAEGQTQQENQRKREAMKRSLRRLAIVMGILAGIVVGLWTLVFVVLPEIKTSKGIGEPVTAGHWQVTLTSAKKTTGWMEDENLRFQTVLLIDATFKNTDPSQPLTLNVPEATVINEQGESFTPRGISIETDQFDTLNGVQFEKGITGFSCTSCQPTIVAKGDMLNITLAFVGFSSSFGNSLKFQFHELVIPFKVK